MATDVKIFGSTEDIEAELAKDNSKNSNVFSGSIALKDINRSYVFNLVNADTLLYILKEAKTFGSEVTIEICRHAETSEVLQQYDHTRHWV